MRRYLLAVPLASLLSACSPGPAASPSPPAPVGDCKKRPDGGLLIVECRSDGARIALPGQDWQDEKKAGSVFFSASRGLFSVSARHSPAQGEADVEAHLRAIAAGFPKDLPRSPAAFATLPDGGHAFTYDLQGLALEGRPVRSTHAWTAARRADGSWIDFHVSWTGPADHPALAPGKPPLTELMLALTGGFVATGK